MRTTGFGPSHLDELRHVVSQSSTPQQIFDHILSAVSVGALPPGTALPPERTLADALEVSRTSVRVALDRLERAGIVIRRRGRGGGTFIAEVSADTLGSHRKRAEDFRGTQLHALEARAVLHGRIASLAAERSTAADIAALTQAAESYAQQTDAQSARSADAAFHRLIAEVAGNSVLLEFVDHLDARINVGFRHDPFSPELFTVACADHLNIVAAIRDGDAQAAARLCENHFRATTMGEATA